MRRVLLLLLGLLQVQVQLVAPKRTFNMQTGVSGRRVPVKMNTRSLSGISDEIRGKSAGKVCGEAMKRVLRMSSELKHGLEKMLARIFRPKPKISQKLIQQRHLSASHDLVSDSRIQKELRNFIQDPIDNLKISVGNSIRQWIVTVKGAEGTVYEGEKFRLKFSFPTDYPFSPPSVYFLTPIPRHEHVYSNGDICLNLLGPGWKPTMTAQGIAISILSMLSSAKEKKIPPDNAAHADNLPGQQQIDWMYHDDKC